MPKKDAPEFSYDEKTKLYRKKIKDERGRWIPIYGKTKNELREKIKNRKQEIELLKELQDSPYVFQFAQSWYAGLPASLSSSRRDDYKYAINKHICPHIGSLRLAEVTPEEISKLMAAESHMSKSMQQKTVCTLKLLFTAAEAEGYIKRSPCSSLKAAGKEPDEKEALTEEQQKTLLDAVKGTQAYPFCMLGLYTGMRREEILALQWDAVHTDGDTPYIEVKRALRWEHNQPIVSSELKTRASRRNIPIPAQLVEYLKAKSESSTSDYVVCSSSGKALTQSQFKNLWDIVRRRQTGYVIRKRKNGDGLEDELEEKKLGETSTNHKLTYTIDFHVTPHILRHTYISRLILAGTNIKVVQYLAGHAKIDMTLNIYTHLTENRPETNYSAIAAAFSDKSSIGN